MMDVNWDGREVTVRLKDDVWGMLEPGTLCLTRKQAQILRLHLNQLATIPEFDHEPEDG
jgi:hypothetical protein